MTALHIGAWPATTPAGVSTNGARWRLRSLLALGHSPERLARALGPDTDVRAVRRILSGQTREIRPLLRWRIARLHDCWWSLVPPERTPAEAAQAAAARARARRNRWCCPLGLDDDELDIVPGYRPHCEWRPAAGTGTADDDPLGLAVRP